MFAFLRVCLFACLPVCLFMCLCSCSYARPTNNTRVGCACGLLFDYLRVCICMVSCMHSVRVACDSHNVIEVSDF